MNLLAITSAFPYLSSYRGQFIKEQLKYLGRNFERVDVVNPINYFPKFLLASEHFSRFTGHKEYPLDYSFGNIRVFFPRATPMIGNGFISLRLRCHFFQNALERALKRTDSKYDLIHSHFILPSAISGGRIKESMKIPLVVTAHGGDIYSSPFHNRSIFSRTNDALSICDAIITTSETNKRIMIETFSVPEKKISIIPNGYDPEIFKPTDIIKARSTLGLPIDSYISISIGSLIDVKGHGYLIRAAKRVIDEGINGLFIIIGAGSNKERLINESKSLGISEKIRIIDGVPHDRLCDWINAADLFVLPSLSEGSPTVVAEALGCGKPVVATNVGNIPFIISGNSNGIIVDPGDENSLKEGILYAIARKWNAFEISRNARERLSWPVISNRIQGIYDSLMD